VLLSVWDRRREEEQGIKRGGSFLEGTWGAEIPKSLRGGDVWDGRTAERYHRLYNVGCIERALSVMLSNGKKNQVRMPYKSTFEGGV